MAELDTKNPEFEQQQGEDYADYMERVDKLVAGLLEASDKVPMDEVAGRVLQFPVADGHAFYLVTQDKPLTLQHIPYRDAWEADGALIRGLTLDDARRRLGHQSMLSKPSRGSQNPAILKASQILVDSGFGMRGIRAYKVPGTLSAALMGGYKADPDGRYEFGVVLSVAQLEDRFAVRVSPVICVQGKNYAISLKAAGLKDLTSEYVKIENGYSYPMEGNKTALRDELPDGWDVTLEQAAEERYGEIAEILSMSLERDAEKNYKAFIDHFGATRRGAFQVGKVSGGISKMRTAKANDKGPIEHGFLAKITLHAEAFSVEHADQLLKAIQQVNDRFDLEPRKKTARKP